MFDKSKIEKLLWANSIVDSKTNCWLWVGAKDNGYGRIGYAYKSYRTHRLSAHIYLGLDLLNQSELALHKTICPHKNCWNPEHLYVGSQTENIKDSKEIGTYIGFEVNSNRGSHQSKKTHCPKGHPYSVENTHWTPQRMRKCRVCMKIHNDKRKRD